MSRRSRPGKRVRAHALRRLPLPRAHFVIAHFLLRTGRLSDQSTKPRPETGNQIRNPKSPNMPTYKVTVACPIHDSFRVQQVAGMFDVPLAEKASEKFVADIPGTDENWQIGLIVGPSGSGKSTIARRAFKENVYANAEWPTDRAVVDCF